MVWYQHRCRRRQTGRGGNSSGHTPSSRPNLRQIIDTIPAFAWSARPDGSVDFMNKHYLEYKGTTLTEQISNHWASVHPDDRAAHESAWRKALATGTAQEAEVRHRRHDGVYR